MIDLKILGIGVYQDDGIPVLLLYLMGTDKVLSLPLEGTDIFALSTALQNLEDSEHPALLDFGKAIQIDKNIQDIDDFSPNFNTNLPVRPIPVKLTLKLIRVLGGQLLGIEIVALRNGYAATQLVCAQGTSISRLGCHVVDGILLALHGKCPLRCTEDLLKQAEPVQEVLQRFPDTIKGIIDAALQAAKQAKEQDLRVNKKAVRDHFQDKINKALADIDTAELLSSGTDGTEKRPRIEVKLISQQSPHKAQAPALQDVFRNMNIQAGAIPAPVQEYLRINRDALRGKKFTAGIWDDLLQILVPETKEPM